MDTEHIAQALLDAVLAEITNDLVFVAEDGTGARLEIDVEKFLDFKNVRTVVLLAAGIAYGANVERRTSNVER